MRISRALFALALAMLAIPTATAGTLDTPQQLDRERAVVRILARP